MSASHSSNHVEPADAPKVYSYARFSNPKQKEGHSEERQDDTAAAWAKRKGLTFDDTSDGRGLNQPYGRHRRKGSLAAFLSRVAAADVPRGSALVVEHVSRLSREGFGKALCEIFYKLWD